MDAATEAQQEMFSHFALISVELANSFWPRKLSAAPIGVFSKRETFFEALVEHFALRLQVVHEEDCKVPGSPAHTVGTAAPSAAGRSALR